MKKVFTGLMASLLVITLALVDVAAGSRAVAAATAPTIMLNGTVTEGDAGYLNSKAIVLASGSETKVNYRLVPEYSRGTATDVRVTLFLPSLEYVAGEYQLAPRDAAPTPLGIQGRVSAGGGWTVLSESATARGGKLELQYDGDLRAGVNPAFDVFLTTYNDGTDGVYGGVPEGTAFEINGFVSYEMFDRVPGTAWQTPQSLDDESRVAVISSDLHWESDIEPYVAGGGDAQVPLWDRYQYIDYTYTLRNTSTNPASNIDGYSATFDIDSTDSEINGIIPFDINRWSYRPGAAPELNDDINDTAGQFVGVPGQGGVLIYDVTDWDGTSELTDEIPYSYSGTGMIVIDREQGEQRQGLTPEGSAGPTERQFRISLPLSRQGFPNPPTMFTVRAITNILFAQTANWSKTRVSEREIVAPTYEMSLSHTTRQPDVVYGWETHNQVSDLRNTSNAPVFNPRLDYTMDPDFDPRVITYTFDAADRDRFAGLELAYRTTDKESGDDIDHTAVGVLSDPDATSGPVTLTFDVSALGTAQWSGVLSLPLGTERLDIGASIPLTITVTGTPYRIGDMAATAAVVYLEKIASNDDYGNQTTYTEVEHTTEADASIRVTLPAEVVPSVQVKIDGALDEATVQYGDTVTLDFDFGVNDATAQNSTTTLDLNGDGDALSDAELTLRAALFTHAADVRVRVVTASGVETELDVSAADGTSDLTFALPEGAATVVIDTGEFTTPTALPLATVTARVAKGLSEEHLVTATMRTYQQRPYDKDTTRSSEAAMEIVLPGQLAPTTDIIGVYGDRRTSTATPIPYEAPMQAEYRLSTGGVSSPSASYTIDMLEPARPGSLSVTNITLTDAYLAAVTNPTLTFVDSQGREQSFSTRAVSIDDVTLDDIASIVIAGTDLALATLTTIAVADYTSAIDMGSSQRLRGAFAGTQNAPYPTTKTATATNNVEVRDTQTVVKIEGVNQPTQALGAGNAYDMQVERYWPCSYYCNSKWDYTLDQGYKSLGGFTTTMTRPMETFLNNDQRVSLDVSLPDQHFDLYYLKIRDELKPYIDTVEIYRTEDGVEKLWRTVDGADWVDNTTEGAGFWRIGTARTATDGAELFTTMPADADTGAHPYYKEPWDSDVQPNAPVSRVNVSLEFSREGANAVPQLGGTHDDVIEYMGRFHSTSVEGKGQTALTATDAFGAAHSLIRRQSPDSINSLVAYPFAQSSTGAQDNTSLANKVITMGEEGHYLASVWNVNTASWPYVNGHGPDVYSHVATELDEWLRLYDPASFHDQLVYEFVYPASPGDDATYNLRPTDVVLPHTSALEHLTQLRVYTEVPLNEQQPGLGLNLLESESSVDLTVDAELRAALIDQGQLRLVYDNTLPAGFHRLDDDVIAVSLGAEDRYPTRFEAVFEQITGYGDNTAELDGVDPQPLGLNLAEVDVRIGGIVNGNQSLRGTSNLYRDPDDTPRALMHTSSATLTGYTPRAGASLGMRFDDMSVYDYQVDGVTPTTSTVEVDIANTSEADLTAFTINVQPDTRFRSQVVGIPSEIFAGDWSATSVRVRQGASTVNVPLARFTLNTANDRYELDLRELFDDGTLTSSTAALTFPEPATLVVRDVTGVSITFEAATDGQGAPVTRLWGTLAVPNAGQTLPRRMLEGGNVFVSGVWVDDDVDGSDWGSKPTIKAQGAKTSQGVQTYASFTATASDMRPVQAIFTSAGSGNAGIAPTLTRDYGNAPALYNRVARLQTHATHLTPELAVAPASNYFTDTDTPGAISASTIVVGDTTRVLYELRNVGTTGTTPDGAGDLPVFDPIAHIEAPTGLNITDVAVVTAASPDALIALIADAGRTSVPLTDDQFAITRTGSARADISFSDVTLRDQESVFFLVDYEAVNDFGAALGATQNQPVTWKAYARPAYTHHVMNYVADGVSGNGAYGTTTDVNFDSDGYIERLASLANNAYRYANPTALRIASRFDVENVSGNDMTLAVSGIANEILHDNTRAELFLTLDTNATHATKPVPGFELTALPEPAYPGCFVGEYDAPRVTIANEDGEWVTFDADVHNLADVRHLRVDYGIVPARTDACGPLALPDFAISGIGHWRTQGAATTKSYQITSQARLVLTHLGGTPDNAPVAEYSVNHTASQTAYKGIPIVEFNVQSFATRDEALVPYSDAVAAATGKTQYRPGDEVNVKLTARNHSAAVTANTGSGKAPLREPVIFDKVPEYISSSLAAFVTDGELDVAAAVAAGALAINAFDRAGSPISDIALPAVTVETVTGLDIAGAQAFTNSRHNDGWGRLSATEPLDTTANPASSIEFSLFTYRFPENLGRGERIEVIYSGTVRENDLPIARYGDADGEPVYAPLYGWYNATTPTAATANAVEMDMAALLHDAGISGDRGHEMTETEFMTGSFAWHPGATEQRRNANSNSNSYQHTYYDSSADSERTHRAYFHETATNALYEAATGSTLDDNFSLATSARTGDGAITHDDRILWAQDSMQLSRAWLYGASELLPDTARTASGTSEANFYEHDGSLNSYNMFWYGYNPYVEDDYTYAVQLDEEFTARLHATNLGDHAITSGVEYLEVLPVGVSPFAADGTMLGVVAYDGAGAAIDPSRVEVDVIQKPGDQRVYAAPAQSQEAGTYSADGTIEDATPYVVRIRVHAALTGMFSADATTLAAKNQRVDLRVRVDGERPAEDDGLSYWYDQLTVTSIDEEPYLEIYDHTYGAFDLAHGYYNRFRFPNDAMAQGADVTDLTYDFGSYTSPVSFEPHGRYVRGLNAQGTRTVHEGKPAAVTGDRVAMRAPTLRVWNSVTKDAYTGQYDASIEEFTVDLYEQFAINATVENQQIETQPEYLRSRSGYNRAGYGDNYNADVWSSQPQTVGGARGGWFEPTVTISLPYGIVPVLEDGDTARYSDDVADQQDARFTALVSNVTASQSVPGVDVSRHLDVTVTRIRGDEGERFVLHFTVRDDAESQRVLRSIGYGQSLTVSPRVITADSPSFGSDADESAYQDVLTLAHSERPVFTPIVSALYATGSVPQGNDRTDALRGGTPFENDHDRRDSTSTWQGDTGALAITERLIGATQSFAADTEIALHTDGGWTIPAADLLPRQVPASADNIGAYGGTRLVLRQPTIVNTTTAAETPEALTSDMTQVDAAGRFWPSTEVRNRPAIQANPYEQIQGAGDVHNSRFLITHYVTNFARTTGAARLVVNGEVWDRAEWEKAGYTVEQVTSAGTGLELQRRRVQWLVTTPERDNGTAGYLATGDAFSLRYELELIDGFSDEATTGGLTWQDPSLVIDSYISLITDDASLIGGTQRVEDFIVQSQEAMNYEAHVAESLPALGRDGDIDGDGVLLGHFAADSTEIEIRKPRAEVRVNTTRPRLAYTNGATGDTYFNSSDTIEYMVTHAAVTGSGLREFVVENQLPTQVSHDSSVRVSDTALETVTASVSSGTWELPAAMIDRLRREGKTIDEVYVAEVLVSQEPGEDGYETGGWTSLGTSSITVNTTFDVPTALRSGLQKVRVVVRSLDAAFLVPTGFRLGVDADPEASGQQDVTLTDPANASTSVYPAAVTDNAVMVRMRVASDKKATLFIYDTAQAWGNFVADSRAKLDQSDTRSYLTPSRPVVNVRHDAVYYRVDSTQPAAQRYGWSDVTAIRPEVSPHLKFTGEVINADESMWSREEDNTYSEDTLIDPVVTFELPSVMSANEAFTYVPQADITDAHPLSNNHRSPYPLAASDAHQWTWKLVRADGSEASADSVLRHTRLHTGPWDGLDRNVVTVWFDGTVFPGDKIVVEFIGTVDAYAPGAEADDLKSRVLIKNNTGLVQPLNSQWNAQNRLGYTTDRADLDDNAQVNDRVVFAERTLFQYETYDNFGKRKVASSDLNRAGTVSPGITPVREGGTFTFAVSVDNTKDAADVAFPYPIIYDVLPFSGDTSITNPAVSRDSTTSSILVPDSLKLRVEGTENHVFSASEYTAYVGPFTRRAGEIVAADMVPHAEAGTEAFYDALATPGAASRVRDAHFVTLAQLVDAAKDRPELLAQARSLLVMFTDAAQTLPGESKLTLTYDMRSPLNAPALLETWNAEAQTADYAQWNSFMATQRKTSFIPQESNTAGVYVTERAESVSIGNYVWHDANYDAAINEGALFVDGNGRTLLRPSLDIDFDGKIDDPGIDGVRVTLLSAQGNHVDVTGAAIHRDGADWVVMDESTGQTMVDDLGQPTVSTGPLTTTTQTDVHGNAGYYTFSNIAPGTYRVMFEFPGNYDDFSVTTSKVFGASGLLAALRQTGVEVFHPGETAAVPAAPLTDALVAITDAATITTSTPDAERMSFDLGVARMIEVGGTLFAEDTASVNGLRELGEAGIEGYHVRVLDAEGAVVRDHRGHEMVTTTDAAGQYSFMVLPREREYQIAVTDRRDRFDADVPVSPIIHTADPFARSDDNDGYTDKGTQLVQTNPLGFALRELYTSNFAPRLSVNVGFYERTTTATIGNRVWEDLDRDGVQDAGEPGISGTQLRLEQYEEVGGVWTKNAAFSQSATSNADGFYAFTDVPSQRHIGAGADRVSVELRYQVVVDALAPGYTFAPTREGASSRDSDFFLNGTMHADRVVGEHLVSIRQEIDGAFWGLDDDSIDLGLITHDLSSLSGEIFIDADADGTQMGEQLAEARFTATLQVFADGVWADVLADANGVMVEPLPGATGEVMRRESVNTYAFDKLHILNTATNTPYEYRVVVTDIPLWMPVTAHGVGALTEADNDFVETARARTFTAVSDAVHVGALVADALSPIDTRVHEPARDVDLGLLAAATTATIGDRVFDDRDADGVHDADEPGVAGVAVALYRVQGGELVRVDAATTDNNGRYAFTAAVADTDPASPGYTQPFAYVVEITLGAEHTLSSYRQGTDGSLDSDFVMVGDGSALPYPISALTPSADSAHAAMTADPVTLVETDLHGSALFETATSTADIDGGVRVHTTATTLGDTVYEDTNADGAQSAGEPGIAGVTVLLYRQDLATGRWVPHADRDGKLSQVTDASGAYAFDVDVADLDKASPHYREPFRYRVVVDADAHLRLVSHNSVFSAASTGEPESGAEIAVERAFSAVISEPVTLIDTVLDPVTGRESVMLGTARDVLSIDAGFTVSRTEVLIGGVMWEDTNADAVRGSREPAISGRDVSLWEFVDGRWVTAADLTGATTVRTDADGAYRFTVAPLHFDERGENFLQPRQYRVTADRDAWQQWVASHQGENTRIDSNVTAPAAEFGTVHTGATDEFAIVDHDGKIADLLTVRDDVQMDMGLRTFARLVTVGGTMWNDANSDGVRQNREDTFAHAAVTLWELIDGAWVQAQDADGMSERTTDAEGRYAFSVFPMHEDETAADYRTARTYRTTVEVPAGHRLSEGATTATVRGAQARSVTASLVTLDADGLVDVAATRSDSALDYPFTLIPEIEPAPAPVPPAAETPLAVTGMPPVAGPLGLLAILITAGIGLLVIARRRRQMQEQ